MRRWLYLSLLLCLPIRSATAAVDFTGTWSGTLTATKTCRTGQIITQTGNATATYTQSGTSLSGAIVIDTQSLNDQCQPAGNLTVVVPLGGTVTGSVFSCPVDVLGTPAQFTAKIANGVMSIDLKIVVENSDITGNLTRTSSQPPASDFSGTYGGTFTSTVLPCQKPPATTFSGTLTFRLLQSGSTLAGSGTITGNKSDRQSPGACTLVDDPPTTLQLAAQVSGNQIAGLISEAGDTPSSFTGTINGNAFTGTLTDQHPGESFQFTLQRTSTATPVIISRFTAGPATIAVGEASTLAFETIGATTVTIDNGIGTTPLSGRVTVSPQQTTTYTLTATVPGGTATATTTLTVVGAGPRVVVGRRAVGMLEAPGSTATDSFTVVNAGTTSANVTLSLSGTFFTATPLTFTIDSHSNQRVSIQASVQPVGVYEGTITVNGDGVPVGGISLPVKLRVVAAPTSAVRPRSDAARIETAAPGSQNPSGTASFTNKGAATLEGIVVSDVPWLIPQKDPVTIPAGASRTITFSIDRSQRPDADSLLGGTSGKLTLVYIPFTIGKSATESTTSSSRVSVSVLDTSTPTVAPGTPPPLAAGEVAFFVDNIPSALGAAGDLFLSNLGTSAISDLKLYQLGGAQASVSSLPASIAAAFPSVAKTVFGVETAQNFQVRTASADNMSVGDLKTLLTNGFSYATAVPVLRSDRGASAGEVLVLPGIEKSSSNSTEVTLQELSGKAATARVQFLDGGGAALGAPQDVSLAAFGATSIADAVPANARAAVITNNSSGAARVNAFARVVNGGTNDGWMVVDSAKLADAPSGTFIVPILPIPSATTTSVDLFATNVSSSAASITIEPMSVSPGRRRAVAAAMTPGGLETTMSVPPMATADIPISGLSAGYVRVTAAGGSVHANGRVVAAATATSGQMGSGLPAIPITAALGAG
ncbi:MAG: hypothetical protein ACXV5L_01255, partial [Thermoanaerobaculia bacterium]